MSGREALARHYLKRCSRIGFDPDKGLSRHMLRQADEAISALRAAGYAIVPREATSAICDAGADAAAGHYASLYARLWAAMVVAAEGET